MQFEVTREFLDDIRRAAAAGQAAHIAGRTAPLHPADIAEVLESLDLDEARYVFEHLSPGLAPEVVTELDDDVRRSIMGSLTSTEIAREVIENLNSDDAADVLAGLPAGVKEEVLAQIPDSGRAGDIAHLMGYDEDSAGGLMARELVKARMSWDLNTCISELRKQAEAVEDVYTVYVVDDSDRLAGLLPLKKLIISPATSRVSDVCDTEVTSVRTDMPSEEVAMIMKKYDLVVLPVVDAQGRLVGRITIDDVVDVIQEEAEKDYQLASGISEDVEANDSIWRQTRARLPWLLIGLAGGVVSAMVVGIFDVQKHYYLAFFIPLIAAMGGNVGVQSSAIIVQSIASKTTGTYTVTGRLFRELGVAVINGLVCSAALLGFGWLVGYGLMLSLTVGASLLAVILFAAVFGTFVPLALHRFRIDPALATGPFITTANDITGLLIYFSIGKLLLD